MASATPKDLEAPLLNDDNVVTKPTTKEQQQQQGSTTSRRLNVLSFGTGIFVGVLSQIILEVTIWDRSILTRPLRDLMLFSLMWSCLTCLLVNAATALIVRDIQASYFRKPLQENKEQEDDQDEEQDNVSASLESYMIGGSLVSISAWWLTLDLVGIVLPISTVSVVVLLIVATTLYVAFCAASIPRNESTTTTTVLAWWSCLIASIFGLVIGFGSQIVLSFFLWTGHVIPKPALMGNLVAFSIIWSLCTVALTFGGCMILRCLRPRGSSNDGVVAVERTYLRMESFYVLSSLIGICFAWITLDMLLGLTQQIAPSLGMLGLSLLVFRSILYCFPEEKCLEELEVQQGLALQAGHDEA